MAIKRIRESEEMYLETILLLRGKKAEVHSMNKPLQKRGTAKERSFFF